MTNSEARKRLAERAVKPAAATLDLDAIRARAEATTEGPRVTARLSDVEALAEEVWSDEPTDAERDLISLVLASDWLAARLAKAEQAAEQRGAERVLTAVEALVDEWKRIADYRTYYGDRARDLRALVAQQREARP